MPLIVTNFSSNSTTSGSSSSNRILSLDLSSPDLQLNASILKQACVECGFFYVVNHGIDEGLQEEVWVQSRAFFALPADIKMRFAREPAINQRGYTPFGDEALDPLAQPARGDCKEGFYIGPELKQQKMEMMMQLEKSRIQRNKTTAAEKDQSDSTGEESGSDSADDSLLEAIKAFQGPNQWPPKELLPMWREVMEKYHEQMLKAGIKITRLLALALDLDADYFQRPGVMDSPMAYTRLLHYSGEVSMPEEGVYGAGAHSDYGMITLLATDGVPGLQICREKDASPQAWEDVHPPKGAFIVNLGDMLERWSNRKFRSTLHRVILSGQERYSIAFFLDPNFDCLVECLPTCCSETNPPRFPPITSGHYLIQRYKLSYKRS